MEICIITGKKNSGKTTWCYHTYIKDNPGKTDGILQVKVFTEDGFTGYDAFLIGSKQYLPFMRLKGKEPAPWDDADAIGQFSISGKALQTINTYLAAAFKKQPEQLVLDEIGALELAAKGFAQSLHYMLNAPAPAPAALILVVRSSLVEKICSAFKITGYRIIDLDNSIAGI